MFFINIDFFGDYIIIKTEVIRVKFEHIETASCPECGKAHLKDIKAIFSGKDALGKIPEALELLGTKKAFLLADVNTFPLAGERIKAILSDKGIACSEYVFTSKHLEPDEKAVGSAIMHYDYACDTVIALGSGVINDIGKMLSATAGASYVIVATAPSMDGYASATSSMSRDGLKVSIPSKCADVIIGDTDLLKTAPENMLKAGIGDMLAKYISICEWRIAHLITGEYYCETIAELIRGALKKCTDNAGGLLAREDEAIEAVFEGLVIGGLAMSYAGVSRPASGVEHYLSHIWDMRALEFGTKADLHGIQCAIGTRVSARLYEEIKKVRPDRERALKYSGDFDFAAWSTELRKFLGAGAEAMIALEAKEGKYDTEKHAARLEIIIDKYDEILSIIREEIPSTAELERIFDVISLPKTVSEIGIDEALLPMTFKASKDIRDKYVLPRLAFDLGILDELAELL